MEFGIPERNESVRPDTIYPISFEADGEQITFYFSPRWDRLDYFPDHDAWALKIFSDQDGMAELWLADKASAEAIVENTGIMPYERDYMTQSEYEAWQRGENDG